VTKKAFALRRVTVTLLPDADLSKKMEAEEKAKIEAFRKSLTSEQVWPRHADCISRFLDTGTGVACMHGALHGDVPG